MENKGLIFIPDISGFTRFVNEMEIEHSRLIIQELLEVLIDSNELGLEVSEIEGDAILFYKFGESPEIEKIYNQVAKMFCDFHRSLITYDLRRFCQCNSCKSAIDLTLKVITHYGEFTGYSVKNYNKLFGKDIIVAHRLLKNNIEQHEYWLVTDSLLRNNTISSFAEWMKWTMSSQQTESGEIPFRYAQLSPLKNEIKPDPLPMHELLSKTKMISLSREYEADIIALFHATGDFNYRSRWQEGVKSVKEVNHFLPRVGMRCSCTMESGEVNIYSTSYSYNPDRIEFSESNETNNSLTHYILEKTGDNKTRLTIEYFVKKSLPSEIIFRLNKKKKMEETLSKSMSNLEKLTIELETPAGSS